MTSFGTSIEEAKFSISGGRVKVELGQASATVPVQQIGDLIRTLEGVRFILEGPGSAAPSASVAPRRTAEPAAAAAAPAAAAAAAAAPTAAEKPARRKRRSRKRVGDALEKWMQENPGWHTEEQLLRAVKQNNMSDADPKRALKIALGKQANELFLKDNAGRWKLKSDPSEAGAAAPAARKRAPAKAAAPSAGRKRRVEAKDESAAAEPAEEGGAPAEADAGPRSALLVKRGQDRKAATLPPGEVEARRQATEAIEGRRKTRWSRVSTSELDRARRNLLGLGPGSKG